MPMGFGSNVFRRRSPRPMSETPLAGATNRLLQVCALYAPGSTGLRVKLHRLRGVKIGTGVFIGTDVMLETAYPYRVSIGNDVVVSHRAMVIAHFAETGIEEESTVTIEDEAFIGPGAIILPNVRIGRGAVVTAGSVVSSAVPPMTVVQGVPAKPVARCGISLGGGASLKEFSRSLRRL
jgi:acetyltransferase-like isoleucine patch superfamily enzyme